MILQNARVYQPDGSFAMQDIYMENGRFCAQAGGETVDASGLLALPGLIDLHFHGCVGQDFCDGTHEAIERMAVYQASHGVTSICPATMTYPEQKLAEICETAASYRSAQGAELVGINMEGPFLCAAKKGAQNGAYLQEPDEKKFMRLQKKADGLVKLLAIAPELDGAEEMIEALKGKVVLSVAHTSADYEIAAHAFAKGASHVTHLFNAMPPFTHRAPGVVGAAMDAPGTRVELICDGVHLHPSMVRAAFRMFGAERVVLISDSMMATGLPDGGYELGGQAVEVRGNRCTLADGTLAGSSTNLYDCMRTAVNEMHIPLAEAVRSATRNPAECLGLYAERGSIETGKVADLLLVDERLELRQVYLHGQLLERA